MDENNNLFNPKLFILPTLVDENISQPTLVDENISQPTPLLDEKVILEQSPIVEDTTLLEKEVHAALLINNSLYTNSEHMLVSNEMPGISFMRGSKVSMKKGKDVMALVIDLDKSLEQLKETFQTEFFPMLITKPKFMENIKHINLFFSMPDQKVTLKEINLLPSVLSHSSLLYNENARLSKYISMLIHAEPEHKNIGLLNVVLRASTKMHALLDQNVFTTVSREEIFFMYTVKPLIMFLRSREIMRSFFPEMDTELENYYMLPRSKLYWRLKPALYGIDFFISNISMRNFFFDEQKKYIASSKYKAKVLKEVKVNYSPSSVY